MRPDAGDCLPSSGGARGARRGKPPRDPRALAILNAEGPAAISRLPRRLRGIPAIEALLRQTYELGPSDPRLRMRLAELAYDLAESTRDAGPELKEISCRAMIELANAYRVTLDVRTTQQLLNRAAEEIARGGVNPLVEARLLFFQSALFADQRRPVPARAAMAAAMCIFRREAQAAELARALNHEGYILSEACHDYVSARACHSQALVVVAPGEEPLITAVALHGLCCADMRSGKWREALAMLRRHRPALLIHRGRNRARVARVEGELFAHEGEMAAAASAFAFSRRELAAIGQPREAGVVALAWAAALRRRGEMDAAHALVAEATELLLRLDPHREVHFALMYLRTANRFSATRADIPLERIIDFLQDAELNPSLRLQSYLT